MELNRKSRSYSFNHTKQRLKERYDLDLSEIEYDKLNEELRYLHPSKIESNGDDKQYIFDHKFKGKKVIFVFSINRGRITTVLPAVTERLGP